MRYEKVHAVWDYHDGVRVGIADLDGAPHYFVCQIDEAAGEYSDHFKLHPVTPDFMERALRVTAIFKAWERKFHEGQVQPASHPELGGIDQEYDDLKFWLDSDIAQLQSRGQLYTADFRALPDQQHLPPGMLRDLEVRWLPVIR